MKTESEIMSFWSDKSNIIVSVLCTTYNQEKYIEDTIKGFLIQRTDFPIEIIIHDDVSSDNTPDILRSYQKKYPNIIKPIYSDVNQFSKYISKPLINAFNYSKGKYISICEGDDYWIDELKLQKQYDVLNSNPCISLVHTDSYRYNQSKSLLYYQADSVKKSCDFFTLLTTDGIMTLTTMFKSKDFSSYLNQHSQAIGNWHLGDLPLWLYLSTKGQIELIVDKTSVYRVLISSASNHVSESRKRKFRMSVFDVRLYFYFYYLNKDDNKNILKKLVLKYSDYILYSLFQRDITFKVLFSLGGKVFLKVLFRGIKYFLKINLASCKNVYRKLF